MKENKTQSVAVNAKTGEALACIDRRKEMNHIYVGLDFHGNRRCSCGGMFLSLTLVEAMDRRDSNGGRL